MPELLALSPTELRQVAAECGLPGFAATQIARRIYVNRCRDIDEMTELSKRGREELKARYTIGLTPPKAAAKSADGTVKYLFEGQGGRDVEAVYIPDHERATLCVSSQAGCRMGCTFCMTGRQGYHGNLTAAQIINQVLSIDNSESLTNIVFMGMGEPMDNLPAVVKAIEVLTAPWGLAWSPKRITVSSIGKLKELKELLDTTSVHIAISAHSPFSDERAGLMPIERAYPLTEVLSLLREYDFAHQRRLTLEYIVWHRINDDMRHADAMARLLKGMDVRVNLIRYHSLPDTPHLQPTTREAMEAFRDRLNERGITATIRASRGEDIQAACGMLAGKSKA